MSAALLDQDEPALKTRRMRSTPKANGVPKAKSIPSAAASDPGEAEMTSAKAEPQFITVLPCGTEVNMADTDACRAVALRVEQLSRGLMIGHGQEAIHV